MKFGFPKVETARPPYGFSTLGQISPTLKYWRTPYAEPRKPTARASFR